MSKQAGAESHTKKSHKNVLVKEMEGKELEGKVNNYVRERGINTLAKVINYVRGRENSSVAINSEEHHMS